MIQKKERVLAVAFICPTDIELDEPVLLSDDLTVKAIDAAASNMLVGTVAKHEAGDAECTVATRFRERRDDRVSAGAPAVGPFVFDATGKAIAFTAAVIATVTGTVEETYNIVTDSNDKLKIKIGSGSGQTFQLDNDASTTAAEVAAKIMLTATDFTASDASGYVKLTADDIGEDIEIEAIANDAYTALGFTVGVTNGDASHDPSAVAGMIVKQPTPATLTGTVGGPFTIVNGTSDAFKIKIGSGSSQEIDLTDGVGLTAAAVAADINTKTTDLTATVVYGQKIKIAADNPYEDIEIETVANNAYTVLGLTVGVTTASVVVETLEY